MESDPFLYTNDTGPSLQKTMTSKKLTGFKDSRFNYFVSEMQDKNRLAHISVRCSYSMKSNFIIILNPYAIGINHEILSTTYTTLRTSQSENFVVLGLTNSFADTSKNSHLNGLYLIGLRCTDQLMEHEKALFDKLDWYNPGSASRLLSNLNAHCPDWSVYQLEKVLPQPMSIEDIPPLAHKIGIPLRSLAQDSISVILACDSYQSIELLVDCLDIAITNCSRERSIQFLIVKQSDSGPITLDLLQHRLKISKENVELDVIETDIVNRGELIHFATESKASGSALLFVDSACQLPSNWDCAIYECLRRPGSGVGFFSTRVNLSDNLINSKDIKSALKCYFFTVLINVISSTIGLPIANVPVFCYAYHLKMTGGYPQSNRTTHLIDLVSKLRVCIGRPILTRFTKASFGILDLNLFNSDLMSTALYAILVSTNWITGIDSSQAKIIISKVTA
ncbi:hypothetical protein Ciccas_004530 [Cichlidogyrus casuarinus]|uniref:Uncharacterized protein n=1 Tax=Cichlidogyrus casuarinus TaxID=1844966 RepID=A0ABD2QER9_9PLAT